MDLSAPHIGYVVAAYGVSGAALVALAAGIYRRWLRTARQLNVLEAEGAPRRLREART